MKDESSLEPLGEPSHDLEISQARDFYIVQHNDLVQKQRFKLDKNATSLTVNEEKILAYILSQIKPDATALDPITINIKTFCEVIGVEAGETHNYTYLKGVITKLASRVMWLVDKEAKTESIVRYLDDAIMRPGEVQIFLCKKLGPYLLNLAGNYFQFSFHNILAMKSKYGIQLYKLLKSYCFRFPRLQFTVDDLKMSLDAENYANFTNFKKKVIEPALKDINTYSDLEVTAEYVKTGRTFTHVIFTIKDLGAAKGPEALKEASRRYWNVEKAIDPDQIVLDEFLGGIF